jgi:chromosome segregation ATPase
VPRMMPCTVHRCMSQGKKSDWGSMDYVIKQEHNAVRSRLSQLDFNYTPLPGFDTHKVKGLVATLLMLKPEDHGKSTMLKITAGSKLDNVIVEDERMGKDLLKCGGIKKCMTLILLNKICAFKLSAEVHPLIFLSLPTLTTTTTLHRNCRM